MSEASAFAPDEKSSMLPLPHWPTEAVSRPSGSAMVGMGGTGGWWTLRSDATGGALPFSSPALSASFSSSPPSSKESSMSQAVLPCARRASSLARLTGQTGSCGWPSSSADDDCCVHDRCATAPHATQRTTAPPESANNALPPPPNVPPALPAPPNSGKRSWQTMHFRNNGKCTCRKE